MALERKKRKNNGVSFRKVKAIFTKEIKDSLRNNRIVFLFLLFPAFAYLVTFLLGDNLDTDPITFVEMHISMIPLMITASLIAEEKDKNTLKVLMLSNVKPVEFLLGVLSFVFLLNVVTTCFFIPLMSFKIAEFIRFLLVISVGIICSTILGAIIGITARAGSNVAATSTPVTLLFALVPLLAQMMPGSAIAGFASILYSGQMISILMDLTGNFTFIRFGIMLLNFLVFMVIFLIIYGNKNLAE